ncbi:hypothetical protein ACRALDRAFT_2043034 [Sodiomyces alcalophilus JCM 7366]|uniref:uncharacterized protein n=1 Tax=Sodiomyces alcalophilus JCM 7366 TaxID=591952 RepID=UPI0039B583DF
MSSLQVIFTISCSFILAGIHNGLGMHNKALDQDREIAAIMYQALATATYVANMMFIKLSIGIFLLRLAPSKVYIWTIYISLAIVCIWSIVLFFWSIFQCSPIEAQWDYTLPDGRCVSPEEVVAAAYSLSVMTILSDWLYALLPIPMIWKVQMSTVAKISVVVLLGLGIFASIATLIRLKFLSNLTDLEDILFAGTDAMVWTLVEPGVAIVAASLVTIRPLLRMLRLRGFQSSARTPYGYGHGSAARRHDPKPVPSSVITTNSKSSYNKTAPLPPLQPSFDGKTASSYISPLAMSPFNPPPSDRYGQHPHLFDGEFHQPSQTAVLPTVPGNVLSPPRPRNLVQSEMYIIEGARIDEEPTRHSFPSPSTSSIELEGMEAHSQDSGRVGLGSGPRMK